MSAKRFFFREPTVNSDEQPEEPLRLAQRIKLFLDQSKSRFKPSPPAVQEVPQFGEDGAPVFPPVSTAVRNSGLFSTLASPSILNDGTRNEFQPSALWSALDDRSDTSSLMIYSPIIPHANSLVEVAETRPLELEVAPGPPPPPPTWAQWVLNGFKPKAPVEKRVWVPSATQMSIQVMWYGYRLYLPPPVLEILNNRQLEATKRAAIITTALQWLVGHIPLPAIPPPLQPVVFLLQQLVPVVGYLGAFIAWSWSTVKSYDTGHGVTLTATWIVPVALVPGTWDPQALNEPPKAIEPSTESSSSATLVATTETVTFPLPPTDTDQSQESPLPPPPPPKDSAKDSAPAKRSTSSRPATHRSATVPSGNALGLYMPTTAPSTISRRTTTTSHTRTSSSQPRTPISQPRALSSLPRTSSSNPRSPSSTVIRPSKLRSTMKPTCCANCSAAALSRSPSSSH